MTTVEDPTTLAQEVTSDDSRCPFPHSATAETCPVPGVGQPRARRNPNRSAADRFVWKLLRIKERPEGVSEAAANSAFQKSMLISATRCTLTYVVFPIMIPLLGILKGVEAPLGVAIGSFAIVCDVFTIRRFFAADHKYRWHFSAIALSIIGLLFVLLAEDIIALFN
ncbi:MAG: hypothetical protein KDA95_01720 [Acidimicrobiales bacterium]|nr:hypothetical protein [Acidimicrobiales bacterium]